MESQMIERLLDKYLAGETELTEEAQLREYFSHADCIPEEWQPYKTMFTFFDIEQDRPYSGEVFLPKKRPYKLWITSAVAVICIVAFLVFNPFKSNSKAAENSTNNFSQNTKGLFMMMGSAVKESKENFKYLNELDTLKTVEETHSAKTDQK